MRKTHITRGPIQGRDKTNVRRNRGNRGMECQVVFVEMGECHAARRKRRVGSLRTIPRSSYAFANGLYPLLVDLITPHNMP
jgi:hypothetical protein